MSCNLKKKFENSKFDFVGKFKYMIIAPVAIDACSSYCTLLYRF